MPPSFFPALPTMRRWVGQLPLAVTRFPKGGFTVPVPYFPLTITAAGILFLAGNLFFYFAKVDRYLTVYGDPGRDFVWILKNCAASAGQLAIMNCGLFLIPVSRSSALLAAMGITTEAAVSMHRWAGAFVVIAVIAHASSYYYLWWEEATVAESRGEPGVWPTTKLFPPAACWELGAIDSGLECPGTIDSCDCYHLWLNLTGFVCGVIFCVIGVTSIAYVRRNHYKFFYIVHVTGAFASLFLVCMHYYNAVIWLSPSFAVYLASVLPVLVQGLHSWWQGGTRIQSVTHIPNSNGCVDIRFARFGTGTIPPFYPGQWVRIHVPEISKVMWHPFSIASSPDDKDLSVIFRSFGGWTSQLEKLLARERKPRIIVDGYYGSRERLHECHEVEHVVMVAGGIGVTPLLSMFRTLYNLHARNPTRDCVRTKTVDLIWTTREAGLVKHVAPLLLEIINNGEAGGSNCRFRVFVYQTKSAVVMEEMPVPVALEISGGSGIFELDVPLNSGESKKGPKVEGGVPVVPTLLSPINGGTMEACLSFALISTVVLLASWLVHDEHITNPTAVLFSYRIRSAPPALILGLSPLVAAMCYKLALVRKKWAGSEGVHTDDDVRHLAERVNTTKDVPVKTKCRGEDEACTANAHSGLKTIYGRPQFEEHFSSFAGGTLAVFLCGPAAMCSSAQEAATQHNPTCDIHQEIFDW